MKWLLALVAAVLAYTAFVATRVDDHLTDIIQEDEDMNPIARFTVTEPGTSATLYEFGRAEGQSVEAWIKGIESQMGMDTLCTTWTFLFNGEEAEGKVTTICGENEPPEACQTRHQEEVQGLQMLFPPL